MRELNHTIDNDDDPGLTLLELEQFVTQARTLQFSDHARIVVELTTGQQRRGPIAEIRVIG